MRLSFSLLLHCAVICTTTAYSLEPVREQRLTTQKPSNETVADIEHNEFLEALLDYESGLVFYKDSSVSACLVERIPNIILESSGSTTTVPSLTIPIPSEEVCLGRDNDVFSTDPKFISEPGLLFCNGLPILDINKLTERNEQSSRRAQQEKVSELVRRKRQSNGYYRTSAPVGEARAQSNWNTPGQASQAQVQGQVFGSGIFSGQAQSQNGGMSQSQVQLSGVGIRGQIASSSGNAQAQLSLGNGAGSGQASGLGQGPSNSQVQVSLGQQGEESMASASATSGGASAGIGGIPGGGAFGGAPSGQYGGVGGGFGGVRSGGPPAGFTEGTRLFDQSGVGGLSHGGGLGYGSGGHIPGQIGQTGTGHLSHGQGIPSGGIYGGNQQYLGSGGLPGAGIGDSRFPVGTGSIRNGQNTNNIGLSQDTSRGSSLGTRDINGLGVGSGVATPGYGQGIPGAGVTYQRGAGGGHGQGLHGGVIGGNGQGYHGGVVGGNEQGRFLQDTSQRVSGTGGLRNGQHGVGSIGGQNINNIPTSLGSTSHGQPGVYQGLGGNGGSIGGNGQYRGAGVPGTGTGIGGGNSIGNGRHGGVVSGSNGATYHTGGGGARPFAQSSTPGAFATTYGLGQAQAQTVYFGNAGNGQYIPLRYDQSSQPGGAPGIHRFQDQQVGLGSAGQRQQLGGNGVSTAEIGSHGGAGGVGNGHRHSLRNGYTSYGHGSGVTTPNGHVQPVGSGVLPSNGGQQHATGVSPGLSSPGSQSHLPNGGGSVGSITGQRPDQANLGGANNLQTSTYTNGGIRRTQGQPQTGHLPGSTGYQNGHGQSTTSTTANGRNGQAYTTNGYTSGGYGQQQTPVLARNGQHHGVNGDGVVTHSSQQPIRQAGVPGYASNLAGGAAGQDGFSPSYGIARPSQEDPEGRKCTIVTFSCTIVIESNGRAKICRPNAVTMNGNNAGGNNGSGSKICCC